MFNRRRVTALLALVLALGAALPVAAAGAPTGRRDADAAAFHDRLLVTWRGLAPAAVGLPGIRRVEATERPMRSVVQARRGGAADLAARLRSDPRVLVVVPDAELTLTAWPADGIPDDPHFVDQPNLEQIGVPEVWTDTIGDPSVVVAVIDSGVDLTHPELDGVPVVDARNVVWNNGDVTDDVGHGTYVTGTIVAETNNGEGIAGIAPGASLMPIKIADDQGGLSLSDSLDAVDWAREHGADIINMSFGGTLSAEQVSLSQPTFTAARDAGILMVAASGNEGMSLRSYPASFAGVVSVGAVDGSDVIADFSTYGKALDLVAPGVDLWGPIPGGEYEVASGTSAASPQVAGVAALVWSARPTLTAPELEAVLRASAVDLGDPGHDVVYGDGRVDALAAMGEPVPDPLPNLEPPAALPELTLTFLAPATSVVQSASTYDVRLESNHAVTDGFAIQASWDISAGRCVYRGPASGKELTYAETMHLTNLRLGRCYRVYAVAVDEDGNYAEAISRPIRIMDPVAPRIVRRRPAPESRGIDRAASVRITFSEKVEAPAGTVRLRNTRTGLIVRTTSRWDAATRTLTIDPVLRMYGSTWYLVEVTSKVQDPSGNSVGEQAWRFRTGR